MVPNDQLEVHGEAPGEGQAPARGPVRYAGNVLKGAGESIVFLAPLALIFNLVGYITPDLRLFILYALLALPLCRGGRKLLLEGGAVLAAAIVVNGVFSLPSSAEILLLVFAHLWIWSLAGAASRPVIQGLTFYTFLHLYLFSSPLGYQTLEVLTKGVNTTSEWVIGATLNLGYTYANIGSLLLFLCLSLHAWDKSMVSKARTAAFLAVALLCNALASAIMLYKVNMVPDLTWELKFRDSYTINELGEQLSNLVMLIYPVFVFCIHAIGYLFLHHEIRKSTDTKSDHGINPGRMPSVSYWGFAVAALVLFLVALPPTSFRNPSPSRLIFLERGVVSFTKPDYTRFGRAAGGMYGFFPEYASLFGFRSEVVKDIPETMEPDQILVVTNLDEPTSPEEIDRIWDFVRSGGTLWVLGDHTFIKNGSNHINDLLGENCHIEFNNDSAQFWPQGWFHSYRTRGSTPYSGLKDPAENRLSMLVGASLKLAPPARPLLVGRFGYGDWGTVEENDERGHLGDFEYQATERCGDLVLIAGESVGKGKVLAFGDTTSFFNANLTRSYEILRASLSWCNEPRLYAFFFSRIAGILVVFGLVGLLFISLLSRATAAPLILALIAALSWIVHRPSLLPVDQEVGRSRLALFDFSHQPYAAKHGSLGEGLYGLALNFLRYDMMPVTQNQWSSELVDNARILFLNAPRRPFSAARRQEITRFMERGGTVLLSCGAHHYASSKNLLDPLGLSIRNLPLGRFFDRPAFNEPIQYFSAWPIDLGPQTHPETNVLSLYGDWPLMVDVPVGEGRLVLVADSEFFHNKNLESNDTYSAHNTQFVRNLLDFVTSPKKDAQKEVPSS